MFYILKNNDFLFGIISKNALISKYLKLRSVGPIFGVDIIGFISSVYKLLFIVHYYKILSANLLPNYDNESECCRVINLF